MELDTIVAVSTAAGRGGIGVVRVSGVRAREVVGPFDLARPAGKRGNSNAKALLLNREVPGEVE